MENFEIERLSNKALLELFGLECLLLHDCSDRCIASTEDLAENFRSLALESQKLAALAGECVHRHIDIASINNSFESFAKI